MDTDVEVSRALDIIAEEIVGNNPRSSDITVCLIIVMMNNA